MSNKDRYAREVLRAGRDLGITPRGIVIGYATVSVECDWIMYANARVPESLNLTHERVGSDGKSVGLFQQQVVWGNGNWWWGDCAACMDPYKSACMFFERLKKRSYNTGDPGAHAQAIQGSAYPDRYAKRMCEAQKLYDRIVNDSEKEPIMGDPVWLAQVLRDEGLEVDEYPGCYERGHGDFGVIWGIVDHHTGGAPGSDNPGYIAKHPQLGLASQLHLNRQGKFTVCGVGIANHAGRGSWPGIPTDNANAVTIGVEAENNGTEGWGAAQYWAYVKGNAAILRKLGLNSDRTIGHKEWAGPAQGKWDPGNMNMDKFRADVQDAIVGNAAPVENQIDKIAGFSPWLGARKHEGEKLTADNTGRFAEFENGIVYWTRETGAIPVPTHILEEYGRRDFEGGPLGYPTRYHAVVEKDGVAIGDIQAFQGGVVYRRHGEPGFVVTGAILDRYASTLYERGPLGWPLGDEYDQEGGRAQKFEHGTLLWHSSSVSLVLA